MSRDDDDVLYLTPAEVEQLERLTTMPAAPSPALVALIKELEDATEELVVETTRLAWDIDPHATTDDTHIIETAADNLNRRLEH